MRRSRVALAVLLLLGAAYGVAAAQPVPEPTFERTGSRCPATFHGGMPPGVFCVYEGVAIGADGTPCAERMLVIWTRLAEAFIDDDEAEAEGVDREGLYFGFVSSPEVIVQATPDERGDRATVHDYFPTADSARESLRGSAELRIVPIAPGAGIEVLSISLAAPIPAADRCALTVYEGSFVGVMTLPLQ